MIRQIDLPTCTLAGATGSAAGTATSVAPIAGELLGVYVNYTGGTSTEDLFITTVKGGQTILQLYNTQTDGWYYPRIGVHTYGGTALSYADGYVQAAPLAIVDYVQAVVAAGGTAGNTVDVALVVRT